MIEQPKSDIVTSSPGRKKETKGIKPEIQPWGRSNDEIGILVIDMSLYHEAAEFLLAPTSDGGSLKARVFKKKGLKSPPNQLYALVLETCKWSVVLKDVIERAELLKLERKVWFSISLIHLTCVGALNVKIGFFECFFFF